MICKGNRLGSLGGSEGYRNEINQPRASLGRASSIVQSITQFILTSHTVHYYPPLCTKKKKANSRIISKKAKSSVKGPSLTRTPGGGEGTKKGKHKS